MILIISFPSHAQEMEAITPENAAQIVPLKMIDLDATAIQFQADGTITAAGEMFSPDGSLQVTANRDENQLIFERVDSEQRFVIAGQPPVSFSTDGRRVAYVSDHFTAKIAAVQGILDEATDPTLAVLSGHFAPITDLAFMGVQIITASRDGSISLWDSSGVEIAIFQGHTQPVTAIAVHENLIISGSEDQSVRVWDVTTNAEIAMLIGHNAPVIDVILDGTQIASLDAAGKVLIWGFGEGLFISQPIELAPEPESIQVEGIAGTVRIALTAGDHPMHLIGCAIPVQDRIVAVGRSEDSAVLIYSGRCEGTVWIMPERGFVDWEAPLDSLPLAYAPISDPAARIHDYATRCESANGNGDFSGDSPIPLYALDPLPDYAQATITSGIGALICHEYVPVTIENCHYLGPGNYSYIFIRYRTDDTVRVVDYATGKIVAEQRFRGESPPACPDEVERGEVHGNPPAPRIWMGWALDVAGYTDISRVKSVVGYHAIETFALPGDEKMGELPGESPINLIAQDRSGEWVVALLPDLTKTWVSVYEIEAAPDLTQLPIASGLAAEIPFTIEGIAQ